MESKKKVLSKIRTLLIYVIIFIAMMVVYRRLDSWADEARKMLEYPMLLFAISPTIMIFFGMLLSFERVLELRGVAGDWKFNWARFLIVVMPLTLISYFYLLYFGRVIGGLRLILYVRPTVMHVAQVVQGYLIVSCLMKNENKDSIEEESVG